MENVFDIFNNDAFSVMSLTKAINAMPYQPGRITRSGLYEEDGIHTTVAAFERKDGVINLIQTSPRGSKGVQHQSGRRKLVHIQVPHLETETQVFADEVQSVREFGTSNRLQTVKGLVNSRLKEMTANLDATMEYHKVAALRGVVLDADDTVLYDLYDVFDVSKHPVIVFDLADENFNIKNTCSQVIRAISNVLGAVPVDGARAWCGDDFFDALVTHPKVEKAYDRYQESAFLRDNQTYRSFEYAGILWENYRGHVNGKEFVDKDKVHFVPMGVPNLFGTYFAPADYNETVNTKGLPRYAKIIPDRKDKYVDVEAQTNPLTFCRRPEALIEGEWTPPAP